MGYFFHKDRGFLHSDVHKSIPEDAHEISDEEHYRIINGQGNGKKVSHDENGYPCLVDVEKPSEEQYAAMARADRTMRLSSTDWTQLPDIPKETSDRFRSYRQALRDVPQQEGFPRDVIWPIHPDEEK